MARQVIAKYQRSGILLDVVGSPTKNGKMKYVFSIQSVNPSTGLTEIIEATSFLPKHAELAAQKGQTVTADIEISQNGQYQNTDLQDIVLGAGIGSGVPQGAPVPVAVPQAAAPVPAGVTVKPPRDFEAEALGKTRHGQFIAALDYVGRLLQAGALPFDASDDVAVLAKVIQFAEAGVYYATTGGNIAAGSSAVAAEVEVETAPIVAVATTPAEVAAEVGGVVQVGTSGLPWGAKEA
jgi:hypothetical protein